MKISHIMSILKILTDLCSIRQNIKIKNIFADTVWKRLARLKRDLEEHREIFLEINVKQIVQFRSDSNQFKSLKRVKGNVRDKKTSHTKKYQDHIPCSFAYKVVYIDDEFSKPVVLYRWKNEVNECIKVILKKWIITKRW